MNPAELILKRKLDSMYKPPSTNTEAPTPTQSRTTLPRMNALVGQQQADSCAPVVLTRNGLIRRAPQGAKRSNSMSDLNVDLDI